MLSPANELRPSPHHAIARDLRDARAQVADIPPNVIVHLTDYAERIGVDTRDWFIGSGIELAQILNPSLRMSYRQARTLIMRALRALHEPAIGLLVGRAETVGSFGLLGLAMMTSRHFGDAIAAGIANQKVCGTLLDIDFVQEAPRSLGIQANGRFGEIELLPFLCEEVFASCLSIARELLGPQLTPVRLELTYARPSYAAVYAETFGCEVRFGAQTNRMLIDAHWVEHPLPGYNPLACRQALALCEQQLRGGDVANEIVSHVERVLRTRLREHPRLTEVAQSLHLSERSLRRRLAESGLMFREIHDRVRAERALELLHAGQLSVAEIGSELGFSDPREFRRAFKRWTGMPPRLARAR